MRPTSWPNTRAAPSAHVPRAHRGASCPTRTDQAQSVAGVADCLEGTVPEEFERHTHSDRLLSHRSKGTAQRRSHVQQPRVIARRFDVLPADLRHWLTRLSPSTHVWARWQVAHLSFVCASDKFQVLGENVVRKLSCPLLTLEVEDVL